MINYKDHNQLYAGGFSGRIPGVTRDSPSHPAYTYSDYSCLNVLHCEAKWFLFLFCFAVSIPKETTS